MASCEPRFVIFASALAAAQASGAPGTTTIADPPESDAEPSSGNALGEHARARNVHTSVVASAAWLFVTFWLAAASISLGVAVVAGAWVGRRFWRRSKSALERARAIALAVTTSAALVALFVWLVVRLTR